MAPIDVMSPQPPRRVLHIAGRVNESVFSLLGPSLETLALDGCEQTLILFDEAAARHLLRGLGDRVSVIAVPPQATPWQTWRLLSRAVERVCEDGPVPFDTVHLHGVLPWVLGSRRGRLLPPGALICFSPHGSRALRLLDMLRVPLGVLMRKASRGSPLKLIANGANEARQLRAPGLEPWVVESALRDVYFEVTRKESRRPLVVAGSLFRDRASAESFAELAVVLGASELGMSFNWVGALSEASRLRLQAAGIGCFENQGDDDALATRLATGWVFIAAGGAREFPVLLAAAMAVGLPTLVADEPRHRELVRHGQTGLIYSSPADALSLLTVLIDDEALRRRIGEAARADARARFAEGPLRETMQRAYAHPPGTEGLVKTAPAAGSSQSTSGCPDPARA